MSVIQREKRWALRSGLWWAALWLVMNLNFFVGCAANRPAATARAGSAAISQRGAAQVPAHAETVTSRASIPLPAGTVISSMRAGNGVTAGAAGSGLEITLPSPAILSVESISERATAPQAFSPPAPPSPADLADGRAVWLYRVALVVGIAGGLFGLVRGWDLVMVGGGCVAAAALVGLFVQRNPVLLAVIGGGVALAVAGVWLWHSKLKHVTPTA